MVNISKDNDALASFLHARPSFQQVYIIHDKEKCCIDCQSSVLDTVILPMKSGCSSSDAAASDTRRQFIDFSKCACPNWIQLARQFKVNILIIVVGDCIGNPYRSFVVDILFRYIILVWDNHRRHSAQIVQITGTKKYFWTQSELLKLIHRGEFFNLELEHNVTMVKRCSTLPVSSSVKKMKIIPEKNSVPVHFSKSEYFSTSAFFNGKFSAGMFIIIPLSTLIFCIYFI
jgi:hypothetical protein